MREAAARSEPATSVPLQEPPPDNFRLSDVTREGQRCRPQVTGLEVECR